MFLSVQAITFEPLHIEVSFLVCSYIFTISRSHFSIKVTGSRSYDKNVILNYFYMLFLCMWLHVINKVRSNIKVKVTHQGQSKNIHLPSNSMSNFTYFNMLILCMLLQVMNKVKFTHQGTGHIEVKVKIFIYLQILCSSYSQQGGGLHLTEMCLFYV